jgi:hypothetical protein
MKSDESRQEPDGIRSAAVRAGQPPAWLASVVAAFTAVMLGGWLFVDGFGSDTSPVGQMKANTATGLLLAA